MGIPEVLGKFVHYRRGEGLSVVASVRGLQSGDKYRYINGDQETADEAFRRLNLDSVKRFGMPLSAEQIDDLGQQRHMRQTEGSVTDDVRLKLRYPDKGGGSGRAA